MVKSATSSTPTSSERRKRSEMMQKHSWITSTESPVAVSAGASPHDSTPRWVHEIRNRLDAYLISSHSAIEPLQRALRVALDSRHRTETLDVLCVFEIGVDATTARLR